MNAYAICPRYRCYKTYLLFPALYPFVLHLFYLLTNRAIKLHLSFIPSIIFFASKKLGTTRPLCTITLLINASYFYLITVQQVITHLTFTCNNNAQLDLKWSRNLYLLSTFFCILPAVTVLSKHLMRVVLKYIEISTTRILLPIMLRTLNWFYNSVTYLRSFVLCSSQILGRAGRNLSWTSYAYVTNMTHTIRSRLSFQRASRAHKYTVGNITYTYIHLYTELTTLIPFSVTVKGLIRTAGSIRLQRSLLGNITIASKFGFMFFPGHSHAPRHLPVGVKRIHGSSIRFGESSLAVQNQPHICYKNG